MTATRGRWIVGAALAAAIVAVVATCRHADEEPPPPVPTAPPAAHESRDDAKPRTPRASRVAATDTAPAETTTTAASDADGWPTLDVEVVHADGTPCREAVVYALAAGAPGRASFASGPYTRTGTGGRGRLVLPRFGTFDVGAGGGLLRALATDVAIPHSGTLRLTLQAGAEVHILANADAIERLVHPGSAGAWVALASDASGDPNRECGRGEATPWRVGFSVGSGDSDLWAVVPADDTFLVETSPDLRAWPATGRAPARISVVLSDLLPAALRLRFAPPDLVAKANGWIVVAIDCGDGPVSRAYHFAAGQLDERTSARPELTEWFPSAGGVVRWHGRGIAAGEATVGAATRTRPAAADLTIVLDGTPLPPDPPEGSGIVVPRTATFDVTVTGYGPDTDPAHALLLSDAGGHGRSNSPPGEVRHMGTDVPAWIAAAHGSRVAPPRRVTEADAGAVQLALEPGGFLVVDCATKPPAELGRLTLQRKDGAPLLFMGTDLLPSIDAITGNKIGPLPPGEHTFVLRLAGFDVGEVTATVVAGETTKLVVPHVPAR